MKPEKLHDALNHIDDELIEAADKVRNAPLTVRIRHTRTLALVATVFMMLVATLIFARSIAPDLTSDGAAGPDNATDIAGMTEPDDKGNDGLDGADLVDGDPGDMSVGVTIERRKISESYNNNGKYDLYIDYFCHDGRIYVPYGEIVNRPYDEVVGEKLGTVTNVFDTEPYGDYYGELHGNMSYDVYKMKDYDESFMLAVDVDGSYYVFINDNDITLKTGSDILRDRFELIGGFSGVTMQYYQGSWSDALQRQYYEVIGQFLDVICDAPVVTVGTLAVEDKLCLAALKFDHNSGTPVSLHLYEGGYIYLQLGSSGIVMQLEQNVFDEYIDKLGYMRFDPDSFVAGIPTPPIERFAFYHKIFPTSTYLYLYTDAHYWPEDLEELDIKYDRSSIKVYYYDPNSAGGIGTVALAFPDNFDTTYDHVTPIYANGGGGSGECEIVFFLDYGKKSVFVAFNNFGMTSSIFDFKYAGTISEADVRSNLQNAQSKSATSGG